MNFSMFILAIVVVFLGLVSGIVLRKYTKQEIEQGKKWFILTQRVLVLVIVGLFMFLKGISSIWIILAVFGVSTAMHQFPIKTPIFYAMFGVFLGLAGEIKIFTLTASLTFLYGLVSGSMNEDSITKYLAANAVFFVAAILMFFA